MRFRKLRITLTVAALAFGPIMWTQMPPDQPYGPEWIFIVQATGAIFPWILDRK